MKHNKIVLAGYMGSGKSTIGKLLAKKFNYEFIDLDKYIEEKENQTVSQIFESKGEIYFRKMEHFYFNEVINNKDKFVLSLGGGTPCYANNHLLLQRDDVTSIYLKVSIDTILKRTQNNNSRPLLQNIDDLKSYVGQHLFERSYFYNYCKFKIENNNANTNNTINLIIDTINK